jgi:hypothetical protein
VGRCAQNHEIQRGTVIHAFEMVMSSVSALLSLVLTIASQASAGAETPSPAEVGAKSIVALNLTTFDLCANAAQIFKKNTLAEHPVILGPFFPGMAPLETRSVPIVYQLVKSVRRRKTALSEVVAPCLNNPNDHRRLLRDSFATT